MTHTHRLAPPCTVAWALANREILGEHMSIEFLRAAMESAPTYPESWSKQEGMDYAAMYLGL